MSKTLNDVAKRAAASELLIHKNRSKQFYKNLKNSTDLKSDTKILGICFDFMAVLDLPKIHVQELYYSRQLSINTIDNFLSVFII